MFDQDEFVAACRRAHQDGGAGAVHDVLARAVADSDALVQAFGHDVQGGLDVLYRGPELTILNARWPAGMIVMPHEHALWSAVGLYSGREDNILWRRRDGDAHGRIEVAGACSLGAGETVAFEADAIHSVVNPLDRITAAIHIYGGDFFAVPRSAWDPGSLREGPFDLAKVQRLFAR